MPRFAASNRPTGLSRGSGKRTSLVAKQLAFQETGRNGRAVHRDESLVAARAGIVNRSRDDFLAGAGFAEQEHGAVDRRDHRDRVEYSSERRAGSDQLHGHARPHTSTAAVASAHSAFTARSIRSISSAASNGFTMNAIAPPPSACCSRVVVVVSSDENHRQHRPLFPDAPLQFEPVHAWQPNVQR